MWSHHKRTAAIHDEIYKNDKIGKLVKINSTFNAMINNESNIRLDPKLEPLGCLGDLGWYNIRGCLFGFNYELPEKVYGISINAQRGEILTFVGHLWYKGGRTAQFTCSFESSFYQSLEFYGTKGDLIVPNFVWPFDNHNSYTISSVSYSEQKHNTVVKVVPEDVTPFNNYHLIEDFAKLVF